MSDAMPRCKRCAQELTFVRQETHPSNPALVLMEFRCVACGTSRRLRFDGWKVPPGLGNSALEPEQ